MEQLNKILTGLKKYHFWVLCTVVVALALIVWNMAAASLSTEFETNSRKITSLKNDLERIERTPDHPNNNVLEGIEKQTSVLRGRVARLWQQLYSRQREEVLKWPPALGSDFIQRVNREKFGADLPFAFRERYQNYVKERFEELREIVKARSIEQAGRRSERLAPDLAREVAGREALETDEDYLVEWLDQDKIQQMLAWEERPVSLKVWVTQEDLWVYETLLKIIARINQGYQRYQAPISVIENLEVGVDAAPGSNTQGRIKLLEGTGDLDEARAFPTPGGDFSPSGGYPGFEGLDDEQTDARQEAIRRELLSGRYLNAKGQPRQYDEVDDVPEFKRLPIRLVLRMDQLRITQLIVECANATLPVEVQQVRINPQEATGSRGGEIEEAGPIRRGRRTGAQGSSDQEDLRRHSQVVIQGIIYIFNPLDREKLGLSNDVAATDQPTDVDPSDEDPATNEEVVEPPASGEQPADAEAAASAGEQETAESDNDGEGLEPHAGKEGF